VAIQSLLIIWNKYGVFVQPSENIKLELVTRNLGRESFAKTRVTDQGYGPGLQTRVTDQRYRQPSNQSRLRINTSHKTPTSADTTADYCGHENSLYDHVQYKWSVSNILMNGHWQFHSSGVLLGRRLSDRDQNQKRLQKYLILALKYNTKFPTWSQKENKQWDVLYSGALVWQ
jgi:hypothetical protein